MTSEQTQTSPEKSAKGLAFADLGLCPEIIRIFEAEGYVSPTTIQQRAIPVALAGGDVLGSSQTGSGKTLAFMAPVIQRLAQMEKERTERGERPAVVSARSSSSSERGGRRPSYQPAKPFVLVLTPTRELALQVTNAAKTYGQFLKRLQVVSVLGGMPYPQQLAALSKQPEIIVATPGRLIDHLKSGKIDLSGLATLVLDEADRMLDMGFIDDIETIVAATPATRQTLLFSATIDNRIGSLTKRLLNSPERIEILQRTDRPANITQSIHWVDDRTHKDRLLMHLLKDEALDQAVVFTATKSSADELADTLADAGFTSAALHGDLPQSARTRTLRALREQRVQILVATDVAARGIDVPTITHVFNYDLPKFAEDYVHRIGRTGRAGRSGIAVSLVHHAEMQMVRRIENFTKQPLPISVIAGFEPRRTPSFAPSRNSKRPPQRSSGGGGRPSNNGRPSNGPSRGRAPQGNGGKTFSRTR